MLRFVLLVNWLTGLKQTSSVRSKTYTVLGVLVKTNVKIFRVPAEASGEPRAKEWPKSLINSAEKLPLAANHFWRSCYCMWPCLFTFLYFLLSLSLHLKGAIPFLVFGLFCPYAMAIFSAAHNVATFFTVLVWCFFE